MRDERAGLSRGLSHGCLDAYLPGDCFEPVRDNDCAYEGLYSDISCFRLCYQPMVGFYPE